MAVEFEQDHAVADLARRTREFVQEVVIPVEEQHRGVVHDEFVRTRLQKSAKAGRPGEPGGRTMFLVDADNPGMTMVRHVDTLDESLFGGHLEVLFDNCAVPGEVVLGAVDEGRPFRIYDGASEAHRWAIARRVVRRHTATVAA